MNHVGKILFAALLWSGICYAVVPSLVAAQSLDCRSNHINVGKVFRPQDASHSAIRLACSGNRVAVVHDGLFYSGMQ